MVTSTAALVQRPLYSYAEADSIADVSRGTAKRWLSGYSYRSLAGVPQTQEPVTPGRQDEGAVSFEDLIEVIAIGRLREIGLSLGRIRDMVRTCRDFLSEPRPLTTLRFKTDGREIFVEQGPTLLELGRRKGQQAWNDVLSPFLQDLDYAEQVARRWWPLGHDAGILVAPDYGFGLPVVARAGVRTEIIREQFEAGESPAHIAYDFNLEPAQVEQALRFEMQRAA
jgi:uncharacterized protein (DUF433 family)